MPSSNGNNELSAPVSTPMVATEVGGNAEIVKHGENGLLVPPGRPAELASAILSIIEDPARATAMGHSGRALFQRSFSLDSMMDAYQTLYRGLCEEISSGG